MSFAARRKLPHASTSFQNLHFFDEIDALHDEIHRLLIDLRLRAARARAEPLFAHHTFRIGTAAIGSVGLGLQFAAQLEGAVDLIEAACRFLCYFTFWTNVIAALSMLVPVLAPACPLGRLLSRPDVRGVVAANLLVVGVVYHFVLSESYEPTWEFVADFILHYVTPALYLADWFLCVPRTRLKWPTAARSVVVPIVYGVWMLSYGAMAQWYPYPFIEIHSIGLIGAFLNLLCLLNVFVVTMALLMLVDRIALRPRHGASAE